jgi:hypothetical protein
MTPEPAASPVFSRKPYTVTYYKDGDKRTLRRVPPQKMHAALPTDKVELKVRKNEDWEDGNIYKVKNITPLQPNTLHIEDEEGNATFVSYLDVELKERKALRPEELALPELDRSRANEYLLWP